MADEVWDCIVVGAGIVGSWTAYHLAQKGLKTLILDQFLLPHTRGSSHGHSRIIRSLYKEDCYVTMMPETFRLWQQLEEDAKTTLFVPTGVLVLQDKDTQSVIHNNLQNLDKHGLPYELIGSAELRRRYPQISNVEGYQGLYDETAGLLLAARCLTAVQDLYKKRGGLIQDGVKVEKIIPGSQVTLKTSKGNFVAKKVVLAMGPWARDLLFETGVDLPVRTMPGLSVFFKERTPSNPKYTAQQKFPVVYSYLYHTPQGYRFVATFTSVEYPGMVKLITRGEPPPYYCHPDDRDSKSSDELLKILVKYVEEHLPNLDPTPAIMEPCVYTMTANKDYIIDRHPNHSNIIIGAGFSGHGFMRAPVIGRLLMELTNDSPQSMDMSLFKIEKHQSKSKL